MEIAIADIDKTPMWCIIGTEVFLSFENPGPVTVDPASLTSDQLKTIRTAMGNNTIVVKGLDDGVLPIDSIVKPLGKSYAVISPDVYEPKKDDKPITVEDVGRAIFDGLAHDITKRQDTRKKEIKSLLGKPIYTAKKNLVGMSISDLRLALEAETEGKGRKSVIDTINDMINKFSSDVSNYIVKNESQYTVKERPLSPQLTDIEESETESVEVDLGDTVNE